MKCLFLFLFFEFYFVNGPQQVEIKQKRILSVLNAPGHHKIAYGRNMQ